MRSYFFIICLAFTSNVLHCQNTGQSREGELLDPVLPIRLLIKGQLREIEDTGLLTPTIEFYIDTNNVEVKVGATEYYHTSIRNTAFKRMFELFELDDFKSNAHYFNPYFEYMGYLETIKEINGEQYVRKFSRFKRIDFEIVYLELDTSEILKITVLSNYINEIAIDILQETIDKESMILANSLTEAFMEPSKVYKLRLRNTKVSSLPPEIGNLTNLRVLDISGSAIKEIPSEIEKCVHLKLIIANASQLSVIPASIGNLKKIRNINFAYCKIKELPTAFAQLESLWSLSLGSNQLSDLPIGFSNLKNLQMLTLDHNKFTEFPTEVLGLECVGNLWLHENDFKMIPSEIKALKGLHHFLV